MLNEVNCDSSDNFCFEENVLLSIILEPLFDIIGFCPSRNSFQEFYDLQGCDRVMRTGRLSFAEFSELYCTDKSVSPNAVYKLGRKVENITWIACDEHESLCERQVGGYPLYLRPSQLKWTCCCSVVWRKISNEAATESSNVHSGATGFVHQNPAENGSFRATIDDTLVNSEMDLVA
ncbi:hypothetical protein TNCV_712031 [Trichonephila clavipes]|nr:hypothetical protein TNCV_712031 [Trichonephila clavipes]